MNVSYRDLFRILSAVVLFAGLLVLLYLVKRQLAWIGTAAFLAIALNPAVERITKLLPGRGRRRRGQAVAVVGTLFLALVVMVGFSLIPPLVHQTQALAQDFPHYLDRLRNSPNVIGENVTRYHLVDKLKSNAGQFFNNLTHAGGSVVTITKSIFSSVVATLTVLTLTIFMLLEGPGWLEEFWNLQPPKRRQHLRSLSDQMYQAVTGYVTGNLLTSLVAAVATAIVVLILGVPYAIPLAIVVGLFDLLPLIGATLGAVVVTLVTLLTTSVTSAVVMAVFFVIYQQAENHLLQPVVYGRTVKMSPLLVFVSAILGTALGGILGALVAIPIAASLQILLKDYIKNHYPAPN